jgi:hypothetical protein
MGRLTHGPSASGALSNKSKIDLIVRRPREAINGDLMIKFFTYKDSVEIKEIEIDEVSKLPLVFLAGNDQSKILYEGKDFELMHDSWIQAWEHLKYREWQKRYDLKEALDKIEVNILCLWAAMAARYPEHQNMSF